MYKRSAVQWSSVSPQCITRRLLPWERGINTTELQTFLAVWKDEFELLQSQTRLLEKLRRTIAFEQAACSGKAGDL